MATQMIDSIIFRFGADISRVQQAHASMRGLTQTTALTFGNLEAATKNVNTAMGNTWNTMKGNPLSSLASGIGNAGRALMNFGTSVAQPVFYLKDLIQTGIGFVQNLFAQNAAMEQTKIAFTGMLGSGTAAQAMLDRLEQFAAATPFEFPELAQDARLLVAMGFAANDVIPIMRNVGDTVAGLGGGSEMIQRIVYSMGQMKSAGRVTGEEMRELALAGVPAWNWLAKAIGVDVPTAMKMAQSGAIDVNVALDALQKGMKEKFGGQMANQARTFNGLMSTAKDNIGMALRAFMGPAFEQAKGALTTITDLLGSPAVKEFATNMGVLVGQGIAKLAQIVGGAVNGVASLIKWFKDGSVPAQILMYALIGIGAAILAFKIGMFIATIPALIAAFIGWATAAGAAAVATIAATWPILAIAAAIGVAVAIIVLVVRNWGSIGPWLVGVWEKVKGFFIGFWNAIVGAWNAAVRWLANLFAPVVAVWNGFVAWLRGLWDGILAFLRALWEGIRRAALVIFVAICAVILAPFLPMILLIRAHWTQISSFLSGLWNTIKAVASTVWNAITGAISVAVNTVRTVVTSVWNAITGFITGVWNAIRSAATTIWNAIWSVISGVLSSIWNTVTSTWNNILGTIRSILGNIWSTISGIFNTIRNTIAGVLSNIWSTITGWAGSIWNALTAPFRNAVDAVAGFMANIWQQVRNAPVIGGVVQFLGGAQGVTNWAGGPLWVGEQGRELLWLPKGSSVTPHGPSEQIAAGPLGTPMAPSGVTGQQTVVVNLIVDSRTLVQAMGQGFADEIRIIMGGAH